MRQRNEALFISALNNLASGTLTDDDMNLLKSREVNPSEVPEDTIRLFSTNAEVDFCNNERFINAVGQEFESIAIDILSIWKS